MEKDQSPMFGLIASQQKWCRQAFPDNPQYLFIAVSLWPDFSNVVSTECLGIWETSGSLPAFQLLLNWAQIVSLSVCMGVGPQGRGTTQETQPFISGTRFPHTHLLDVGALLKLVATALIGGYWAGVKSCSFPSKVSLYLCGTVLTESKDGQPWVMGKTHSGIRIGRDLTVLKLSLQC